MRKIFLIALMALTAFSCNKATKEEIKRDSIAITPNESGIGSDGGSVKVIVTSSGEWTLSGKADYSSWVTPSATKGGDGDIVTFKVEKNVGSESKIAEWVFTCGKATDVLRLTSHGIEKIRPSLKLLSEPKLVLNEEAGEIDIRLSTEIEYREVKNSVSENASEWIEHITTLEVDGGVRILFSFAPLAGLKDRKAEITIYGADAEPVKVEIIQEAKRVLNAEKPFYAAPVKGGDLDVLISANVEYDVIIPEDAKSWLSVVEKKEDRVRFNLTALKGDKRSADVIFTQTNAKAGAEPLKEKISISQANIIISWAANMKGNRLFPKWEGGGPGKVKQFSLETLVKFDNFDKGQGEVFTIMGIENVFLLRMGDSGNSLQRLQIATPYGNYNVPFDFKANIWYHIAVTSDNLNLKVYVDGELKGQSKIDTFWGEVNLSPKWSYEKYQIRSFWIGYSLANNRDLYGQITEIRIWNKILTAEEINQKDHFYTVDPKSEGLFSYWPFKKSGGDSIEDATGRGNSLYGETNVREQDKLYVGDAGIEWVSVSLPEK